MYTFSLKLCDEFFGYSSRTVSSVSLYPSWKSKRPRQIYDPNPWGAPTGAQQSMRNLSSGSYVLKRQTQPICGTLSTPPPPPPASCNSGSYSHGPIEFKIEEGDRFNRNFIYSFYIIILIQIVF